MIVTSFDSSSSSKVQYCIEISSLKKKLYPLHRDSMSDMIRSGSASVYNFVEFTEVTDPPYSAILLWCNEGGRAPFASACRRQWSNPKIFTNSHSTFPHFCGFVKMRKKHSQDFFTLSQIHEILRRCSKNSSTRNCHGGTSRFLWICEFVKMRFVDHVDKGVGLSTRSSNVQVFQGYFFTNPQILWICDTWKCGFVKKTNFGFAPSLNQVL